MKYNKSCNALVIVNKEEKYYNDYIMLIKPYLDHFGIPYDTLDLSSVKYSGIDFKNYSVLIPGHINLLDGDDYPGLLKQLDDAIMDGTGLCSFDSRLFAFSSNLVDSTSFTRVSAAANTMTIANNKHYISGFHESNEKIQLLESRPVEQSSRLVNSIPLVYSENVLLLETGTYGSGRIIRWNDYSWMCHKVRGPFYGLDDLVWKGIVWAARKPFVMQGMPRFATMRIDDVWGFMDGEDPLSWVGTANKYGFKPWLGVFQKNMSNKSIECLKSYIDSGNATAFPHGFAGETREIEQFDKPEEFIYFDHFNQRDYSDEVMIYNAKEAKEFFDNNRLTMSKVAIPHYYEYGLNSIQHILDWGCEFIGTLMQPGEYFYTDNGNGKWLTGGPYRLFEMGSRTRVVHPYPVYYADYLKVNDHPEFDNKLFNCLVEVRDDKGYEWYPNNDVKDTVMHGVKQLRRSFDSFALAALFCHESDSIKFITPENWDAILKEINELIAVYNPKYVTLDYAYRYARAKFNIKITDVQDYGSSVNIKYSGSNDMDTYCYKFHNAGLDGITETMVDIPQSSGNGQVER